MKKKQMKCQNTTNTWMKNEEILATNAGYNYILGMCYKVWLQIDYVASLISWHV